MIKYVYDMTFDPSKIADSIASYIGHEVEVGVSGNRSMSFTVKDTDLTPVQRQTIIDNLPEFVRMFYSFSRTVVQDDGV